MFCTSVASQIQQCIAKPGFCVANCDAEQGKLCPAIISTSICLSPPPPPPPGATKHLRVISMHSSALPSPAKLVPTQVKQVLSLTSGTVRIMLPDSWRVDVAPGGRLFPKVSCGRGMPLVDTHSSVTPVPMTMGRRLLLPLIRTMGAMPAGIQSYITNHGQAL